MNFESNALYNSDAPYFLERMDSGQVTLVYLDPPFRPLSGQFAVEDAENKTREWRTLISHVVQQARRVLSDVGSLYFHAEPAMAGWVRPLLDEAFGVENFRAEYIWPSRQTFAGHTGSHSSIYSYSRSKGFIYNPQPRLNVSLKPSGADENGQYRLETLFRPSRRSSNRIEWKGVLPPEGHVWRFSPERLLALEQQGRIWHSTDGLPRYKEYLNEIPAPTIGTIWDDIGMLIPNGEETEPRYVVQQPKALLERIIRMATNEGDLVVDPFCGSGTTLVVAEQNERRWIGCDELQISLDLVKSRLKKECHLEATVDYVVADSSTISTIPIVSNTYYDYERDTLQPTKPTPEFIYETPMEMDETRHYEYKEITSPKPIDVIKNTADEYAVAYLNCGGGYIYWGVRNADRHIVGVPLNDRERDELRRLVVDKLVTIQPSLDPSQYHIEIYPVVGGPNGLYVVELMVPDPHSTDLYFTGGGAAWVKTDSGKKKLNGAEMNDWMRRRVLKAHLEPVYETKE